VGIDVRLAVELHVREADTLEEVLVGSQVVGGSKRADARLGYDVVLVDAVTGDAEAAHENAVLVEGAAAREKDDAVAVEQVILEERRVRRVEDTVASEVVEVRPRVEGVESEHALECGRWLPRTDLQTGTTDIVEQVLRLDRHTIHEYLTVDARGVVVE